MAHYEDIIYNNDKELKCKLCDVSIQDENRLIEAHINSESHRALMVNRTLVQQSILVSMHNFYCRLCAKILNDSQINDHILSSHHAGEKEKLNNIINKDGGFLWLPDKPSENEVDITCVLCNDFVPFSMTSAMQHLSSARHRRARAIAVQALNGIFSVEGSNDDVWCKFCRIYLENYIEVIFQHVDEDTDHRNRIAKILNIIKNQNITIDRYLMDPKEDKAQCHKCDKAVSCNIDNLERHVKGKLHNK